MRISILILQFLNIILKKRNKGLMEKWLIPYLKKKIYNISVGQLVMPEKRNTEVIPKGPRC